MRPQRFQGFLGGGHPGEHRRARQVEAAVLVNDALRQAAFLLHDEGFIRAADQEDVGDLAGHQLVKDLEGEIEVLAAGRCLEMRVHGDEGPLSEIKKVPKVR